MFWVVPLCKTFPINNIRGLSTASSAVLGIRRENKSVWERRAPFSPQHVGNLVKDGVRVLVQPSTHRVYTDSEYYSHGAEISDDLSAASVIMGVKEVAKECLLPNKTYCFFSHTIKAQKSNMSMLDDILRKNIRLIDYETICDDSGQRIVAFGRYAGISGMINILHGLGMRLMSLGYQTPFMGISAPHNYCTSDFAREAARRANYDIERFGLPIQQGPLVFVFTGSGNVSKGAQDFFSEFNHDHVNVTDLAEVVKSGSLNKLYKCHISRPDYLVRASDGGFDAVEYPENPERYRSTFYKNVFPYASCIVHGSYWDRRFPRLVSNQNVVDARVEQPNSSSIGRLLAVCDITSDVFGSLEFVRKTSTIREPFYTHDFSKGLEVDGFDGPGVLVCSVDNMPAQLPRESTEYFGDQLMPLIRNILLSNASSSLAEQRLEPPILGAVIASNGRLTSNFEYITKLRNNL